MGELIEGDDGLPAEDVGCWVKDKHDYLCRYVDISRGVRSRWTRADGAGATFIDLFCGPGRCRIRETSEWIDGGVVSAWRKSLEGGAPFTQVFIADLADDRRAAAAARLRALDAPVTEVAGPAMDAVKQIVPRLNPYGLHFAFLDPFNLGSLDFDIIRTLSTLKRIDMLVHVNQMDLQRNLERNTQSAASAFDTFAPGWRDNVDLARGQEIVRQQILQYWRDLVASLGVWPSAEMKLIRGRGRNQPLYWLLLAAKHDLAHRFWATASNVGGQGSFEF